MRTCVGCGRRTTTDQLVRVTRGTDGRLVVGRALPGRGAWLCAGSPSCLERAGRRGAFTRALRAPVGPEAVRALQEQDPFAGAVDRAGEGPPPPRGSGLMCEDREPGCPPDARTCEGH